MPQTDDVITPIYKWSLICSTFLGTINLLHTITHTINEIGKIIVKKGVMSFKIFINDLIDGCNNPSELFVYADDANLFRHNVNINICSIKLK